MNDAYVGGVGMLKVMQHKVWARLRGYRFDVCKKVMGVRYG